MKIVLVQVGMPKQYLAPDLPAGFWETATYREPLTGPVRLSTLGLDGDGHADPANHGGPDKAILMYSASHYPFWQGQLGIADFGNGALGENLTVEGATESEVCLGDQYAVGDALIEVSQPRQPCWKQARRWGVKDLVVRMNQEGRSGWYFRVLREGSIQAGMEPQLVQRPFPEWTIARANRIFHFDKHESVEAIKMLLAVPTLAESWRRKLSERL
jgi:MOSC domain-containing protein YiiM